MKKKETWPEKRKVKDIWAFVFGPKGDESKANLVQIKILNRIQHDLLKSGIIPTRVGILMW